MTLQTPYQGRHRLVIPLSGRLHPHAAQTVGHRFILVSLQVNGEHVVPQNLGEMGGLSRSALDGLLAFPADGLLSGEAAGQS